MGGGDLGELYIIHELCKSQLNKLCKPQTYQGFMRYANRGTNNLMNLKILNV